MRIKVVFGTNEKFQHFLPTKLAVENMARLKDRCRLALGVGAFWSAQVKANHSFLKQADIPHVYLPDLTFPHRWDSGWFSPMAEDLVKVARAPKN